MAGYPFASPPAPGTGKLRDMDQRITNKAPGQWGPITGPSPQLPPWGEMPRCGPPIGFRQDGGPHCGSEPFHLGDLAFGLGCGAAALLGFLGAGFLFVCWAMF